MAGSISYISPAPSRAAAVKRRSIFSVLLHLLTSLSDLLLAISLGWTILASSYLCSQHLYHLHGVTQNKENERWSHCTKNIQERNTYFSEVIISSWKSEKNVNLGGRVLVLTAWGWFFLLSLESTLKNQIQIQKKKKEVSDWFPSLRL